MRFGDKSAPDSDPPPRKDEEKEVARLRELNEFKTNFINATAHELSTPLTPIRLQLHMLKSGERGTLSDAQRWSVEVVDRNVERLSSLVKDLLDVARLDAARFPIDMRPSNLSEIVDEAVNSFLEPAARAGVEFTSDVEPDLLIMADTRRVVQVLFSLLSNAVKFTPGKGKVRLVARRTGGDATITVEDTGVGFRPEDKPRLFQAFSQIFNPDVGFATGAGLGLYISKSIVELHGGRIWAHSDGQGKGSRFSFTVPIAPQGESSAPVVRSAKVPAAADDSFSRRLRQLV